MIPGPIGMASSAVAAGAYAAAGDRKQMLIAAAGIGAAAIGAGGAVMAFKAVKAANNANKARKAAATASNYSKMLADGRVRKYEKFKPAANPGKMIGSRKVKEVAPNGKKRVWYETYDKHGRVRQVRPFDNNGYRHYTFDKKGKFTGKW
jgi:hypothetical protein